MANKTKHIAIFASGNGSNFEAIVQACADGHLAARVVLLVCDKPGAYVIERANKWSIPVFEFEPKEYAYKAEYEAEIIRFLKAHRVDWICLAGYMRLVSTVLLNEYEGRIINIHPSLLPAFKGLRAIEQAYEYGVKITGVTTHFVDNTLDGGTIIDQVAIPTEGCDLEELQRRIHTAEHELYVKTINTLLASTPLSDRDN